MPIDEVPEIKLSFDSMGDKARLLDKEPPHNWIPITLLIKDRNNDVIYQRTQYLTDINNIGHLWIEVNKDIRV